MCLVPVLSERGDIVLGNAELLRTADLNLLFELIKSPIHLLVVVRHSAERGVLRQERVVHRAHYIRVAHELFRVERVYDFHFRVV